MDETSADKMSQGANKGEPCIPTRRPRPEILSGATYKLQSIPDGRGKVFNHYIAVNNDDENKPFEIFDDCSDKYAYEFMTAINRLVSLLMQYNVPVVEAVESLRGIQSHATGHFLPNGRGYYPSLVSRVAMVLQEHYMHRSD